MNVRETFVTIKSIRTKLQTLILRQDPKHQKTKLPISNYPYFKDLQNARASYFAPLHFNTHILYFHEVR